MSGYLQRKKPMKRSTPLRKMSAKKAVIYPLYRKAVKIKVEEQIYNHGCTYCERCGVDGDVEPHHTHSRVGPLLLVFKLICAPCHRWIHSHTKQAKLDGWLIDSTKRLSS